MADLKTQVTKQSVKAFIAAIDNAERRKGCEIVSKIMQKATGEKPKVWVGNMVGFGKYDYTYASGHSGSWFITGFASRKASLTVYIMAGFTKFPTLMKKLGKYKISKSCLYIKKIEDIDLKVLEELIKKNWDEMKRIYS